MPRKPLEPRLYLDPTRKTWIIRDAGKMIRTGCDEANKAIALKQLETYKAACPKVEEREKGTGYVYFMTAAHPDFPIKIGFTERLGGSRKRSIQTSCPYPLVTLATFPGTIHDERRLHAAFDHLRLEGEWFRRDEKLLSHISSICPRDNMVA